MSKQVRGEPSLAAFAVMIHRFATANQRVIATQCSGAVVSVVINVTIDASAKASSLHVDLGICYHVLLFLSNSISPSLAAGSVIMVFRNV